MGLTVIISLFATILTLYGAIGQTDDVYLSVKRGPEPEAIQGRPGKQGPAGPEGPVGSPGPQGSCTCEVTDKVRNLTTEFEELRGLKFLFTS